ncbi:MAG: NADH-quinone oxidoreductase subunit N, partial [bacterium]
MNTASKALQANINSLAYFGPELVAILLLSLICPDRKKRLYASTFGFAGLVLSLTCLIFQIQDLTNKTIFHGLLAADPMAHLFKLIFLMGTIITSLMVLDSNDLPSKRTPEFLVLLLTVFVGMSLLGSGLHLLILYLALELVSLPSYVMAGYNMTSRNSAEAGIKYLVYGAVAGATFLYGASLIYGVTGQFTLSAIGNELVSTQGTGMALGLGLIMMLVGIGYKCSFFPMHMWVPDVYQGAPTAVGGFLSTAPKAAGFAVLIRLTYEWVPPLLSNTNISMNLTVFFVIISAVTMTVGNLSALAQNNIKRMLGYSTVAHVGYILMGYTLLSSNLMVTGFSAIGFYLIIYTLMNLGAFLVVVALEREWLEDVDGMFLRAPVPAVCMAIFLFSLTGLPPLAGFAGKFV